MKQYNLNAKKFLTVFGLTFVLLSILFLVYNAGMNSSTEALSTNSDLTVTETEDGYAIHKPQDNWVYGRDEYDKLIPYEEDRKLPSEGAEVVGTSEENLSNEKLSDVVSSDKTIQPDTNKDICGLTYNPEKGFLEVVSCTNDNGHITYRMYDYLSNTTFVIQLFNGQIENTYTDNPY